jgi:Uma2 family endonuclease
MTVATDRRMTLQEFLTYDDGTDTRHELIKGELIPMSPPTWLHLRITRYLESAFNREIERLGFDWEAFQEPGQQTESSSARRPDVAIVPSDFVDAELDQSAILVKAAILVVEVVSESTATADYREKVSEYQAIGIPEYWIVDPDPFGAAKYIGSPKRPTVSVYHVVDGAYQVRQYRGNETIASPTFPDLHLTAAQVLAGKRSA